MILTYGNLVSFSFFYSICTVLNTLYPLLCSYIVTDLIFYRLPFQFHNT